ncbi:MAG: GNAT family N-acetyltransferase [Myxococcota bacterium]|jgi:RimJ/RimL family protein N-acetyltransferase|nr:GNAT family N-acetyltransferase [Myxococcota bacterium]
MNQTGNPGEHRTQTRRTRAEAKAPTHACLPGPALRFGAHALCALREQDIEAIRVWRNAQIDVLRQSVPITPAEQQRYFDEVIRPTFKDRRPRLILLSLLREELCVGYCGLTNVDWPAGRAEISFLLDPMRARDPRIYREDMSACLELLSRTAFERLGLNRLFAETFDIRPDHIAILEAHGYACEGRMREHVTVRGVRVDSLIHGLLATDWRGAP